MRKEKNEAEQFNWLLTHKMRKDDAKLSELKESVDTNGNYINCDFILYSRDSCGKRKYLVDSNNYF